MFKRITTTALMLSAPVAVMAQMQAMPEAELASIAGRDSLPSEPFQRVIVMDQEVFLPADGDNGGNGNGNGGDDGVGADGPIVTLLDRKGELLADIAERRQQVLEERAELLAQLQGPIGQALQQINERRQEKIDNRIDFYENELGDGELDILDVPVEIFTAVLDKSGNLLAVIPESRIELTELRQDFYNSAGAERLAALAERRLEKLDERREFLLNEVGDGDLDIGEQALQAVSLALDSTGQALAVIPQTRAGLAEAQLAFYGNFNGPIGTAVQGLTARRIERLEDRAEFLANEVGDGELDIGEYALQAASVALDSTGQALAVVPQTRAELADARLAFYGNFDGPIGTLVQDLTARRIENLDNRAEFLANQVGDGELDFVDSQLFVPVVSLTIAGGVSAALATDIGDGALFGIAGTAAGVRATTLEDRSATAAGNNNFGLAALYDVRSQWVERRANIYGNISSALDTP